MTTVLIVGDEPAILELLQACCEGAGYRTISSTNGREALRLFFQHHPELVIADIRMPEMNGFELVGRIREVSEVPIIILSALGREDEKVQGLQLGADDFLVKPIGVKEMTARIEATLRRAQLPPSESKGVYTDGVLTIHLDRQEVFLREKKVDLTPKELRLLAFLTQQAGRVVSVKELLQEVWGSPHHSEEVVKWHISSLRRKIEFTPRHPKIITTVWGSGYRYDRPSQADLEQS